MTIKLDSTVEVACMLTLYVLNTLHVLNDFTFSGLDFMHEHSKKLCGCLLTHMYKVVYLSQANK